MGWEREDGVGGEVGAGGGGGGGDNGSEVYVLVWNRNDTQPMYRIVQAINLYLIPVIGGVGLVGGLVSYLVLTLTTFRYQPCSRYLAVLTAADSGFLLALLIGWLTTLRPSLATMPGYCQVMVYMTYTCSFLSAWYLVLLMVERYITVCHPLRAPVLCTRRHALLAIGGVTGVGCLLYLHSFFTTRGTLTSPQLDSPCRQEDRHLRFLAIFTYIDILVSFLLPFVLIFALNLRIILAVRRFRRRQHDRDRDPRPLRGWRSSWWRGEGGGGGGGWAGQHQGRGYGLLSQAQVRASQLLVWVATVFLLLYLPSHALRLYLLVSVLTQGEGYSQQVMLAQQICQFIYYINFAVDFFVFSVTSNSFRRNVARCIQCL